MVMEFRLFHYNHPVMSATISSAIHGFLLDMDGTFYLGNQLLPGAREFYLKLVADKTPFLFLTNNSSKSSLAYQEKLSTLGIDVPADQIITSGRVAVHEIAKKPSIKNIALLGNQSLFEELSRAGFKITFQDPDIALLGYDNELTYDHLSAFCSVLLRKQIPYFATHADLVYPSPLGFLPDAGAIIESVFKVTGSRPSVIFGKPNSSMVSFASAILKTPPQNLAMIGDRLYTDIAMKQHGVITFLSLTGETKPSDLSTSAWKPDHIINDLRDLL